MSQTEINEKRIRSRKSYEMFKRVMEILNQEPLDKKRVLMAVIHNMDAMKAFGSQTASDYAYESVHLILKEEGLE
jgi:hypothetical protein